MTRLLLTALCGLFLLPTLALAASAKSTAPAATPVAITPMEMQTPLRGVVTLVEEDGLFYTDMGSKDGMLKNAYLLIVRGGYVIARARVTKVGMLDSIGCLLKEKDKVRLAPGDVALVQYPDGKAKGHEQLASAKCTPDIEPNESQAAGETLMSIVTLFFIGMHIATN
ncbi:MAG: hypothetical protein ACYC7E_11630 [Armatimonadota bacterium]